MMNDDAFAMDDRWPTLKRLFEDDGGPLSEQQRRAFRLVPSARPTWQSPQVRVVGERERSALQRARVRGPRATAPARETWIVTSADRRFWSFLTCFIASLREVARYGGRLAVIDYGLTEDQRRRLQEHGVLTVHPLRRHAALVIDRYLTLTEYFRDDPDDTILYFDADIWFADRIDELFTQQGPVTNELGAAKDVWKCDYYLRCTHDEHHATVRSAVNEVIRDYGQTLQAGFIAGPARAWARYASLLGALLAEGFAKDAWGTDALALNFYAALYPEHFVLLPITYNAPPLWGVVREGTRFFATKFHTDSLYRPEQGRVPVKAIHYTSAVRHRTDLGLAFGDVYPEILEKWSRRLGS